MNFKILVCLSLIAASALGYGSIDLAKVAARYLDANTTTTTFTSTCVAATATTADTCATGYCCGTVSRKYYTTATAFSNVVTNACIPFFLNGLSYSNATNSFANVAVSWACGNTTTYTALEAE